jgi:hypothetical protein
MFAGFILMEQGISYIKSNGVEVSLLNINTLGVRVVVSCSADLYAIITYGK